MDTSTDGMVFLIGAGPGDPDLITVKGRELLFSCDAVVYDHLVPLELVILPGESVDRHYVGKRAGEHAATQEEINALLVRLAKEGKRVARLKGGDPFVFGRGGEEARYLKDNNVPYAIVPGITAGVAGPAYAGIPVTERTRSSYVILATGHKARDKETSAVPWSEVARLRGGTLVIYMGVGEAAHLVEALLEAGISPEAPACAIQRATSPLQRIVSAPLKELPGRMAKENIQPPALICIGEVVNLWPKLEWFTNEPLGGVRVMVTRPADQAADFYGRLRRLGAEVLPFPTIATREHVDERGWERCMRLPSGRKWLVFTSENGVRYFMRQFPARVGDMRRLGEYKIAAVGTGTARALETFHLTADFIPGTATVAELARQMVQSVDVKGAAVIRVQGDLSDDTIAGVLASAGADVVGLTVYETYASRWPAGFKQRLLAEPPDVIMFSSGSTVDHMSSHLSADEIGLVTAKAVIVSIGPSTSSHVYKNGMKVTVESSVHSIPGMVDEMVAYLAGHPVVRT